jgi:hypothetical protein
MPSPTFGGADLPPAPLTAFGSLETLASEGPRIANVALLGQFMASSFASEGDFHGSMAMADAPASQPPLLAHPHA